MKAVILFLAAAVVCAELPSLLKSLPFTRIADEIYGAEQSAQELTWKVSNSTAEKSSLQWFMASAMKELTVLTKEVMNRTSEGSLGYQMQSCINRTEAPFPAYNKTLGLKRSIEKDQKLAPAMLEAEMYAMYYSQTKSKEIKKEIGGCRAKCPVSLLSKGIRSIRKHEHQEAAKNKAPGGGLERAGREPNPREMMKSIADAIYNTSESIDNMREKLSKDSAAKDVLQALSATVMGKLLNAKKEVEDMTLQLEVCHHTPEATHMIDPAEAIMGMNSEVSFELVKAAQDRTAGAKKEASDLEDKLSACRKKCDVWYQYHDEIAEQDE